MHTHTYIYVVYFITYKHIYICLFVNVSYIHMKWSRNISSNITWRSFSGRLERGGRCWSRGCCYAVGTDVNHAVTLHTKKVVYITGKCVHIYIQVSWYSYRLCISSYIRFCFRKLAIFQDFWVGEIVLDMKKSWDFPKGLSTAGDGHSSPSGVLQLVHPRIRSRVLVFHFLLKVLYGLYM